MKRLMIAATLLLAATSMSVWAQAPGQPTPPAAMPMTNCGGNSGAAMAEGQKTGCPMAPDSMKSGEGAMPMHQMMHGMMHGQPQAGANQPDQVQGGMKCCEMSKSDKSQ